MKGIIKTLIVALVGLFFMLSACEISTAYFSNTFGDDYDCYILPDNTQPTNHTIKFIFEPVCAVIPSFVELPSPVTTYYSISTPVYSYHHSTRLYLKNRILLI